jgi:hypothetical protein
MLVQPKQSCIFQRLTPPPWFNPSFPHLSASKPGDESSLPGLLNEIKPMTDSTLTSATPVETADLSKAQTHLSGAHQKTYQHLFQHPIPHNLQWRDVWAMINSMKDATAVEDDKGNLKVSRNGQTLILHRPRGKDLADKKELMQVRHFLERSGTVAMAPSAAGTHLLVVIDHREARIYSAELHGTVPQRITPYDPFGFDRALHYNQDDSNGQRKPELKSFYDAVGKTLRGAQQIVMFGTGTGSSSAMEHLMLNLKTHHADLVKRVIHCVTVDEHHLTEDQLLAKARELFVAA